jgi:hypothetical protein
VWFLALPDSSRRTSAPHQRAAMGAAIDEGMHRTALVAIDDDRRLAEISSAKIARVRDFDIER